MSRLRRASRHASIRCSLAFAIIVCGLSAGQSPPSVNPPASSAQPISIIDRLAPDGVPPATLQVKQSERTRTIQLLFAAKREESGWRKELAIYMLATLGQNYEENRNELLREWRKSYDDNTMELLIGLYDQGHHEFLRPLLAAGPKSDAALAEGLGTFYADQLEKDPVRFLAALSTFPAKVQGNLCELAGETDGGGMASESEQRVVKRLRLIGSRVATRCALGVRAGNQAAAGANKDLQRGQPKER
jgi:hypothetical protein